MEITKFDFSKQLGGDKGTIEIHIREFPIEYLSLIYEFMKGITENGEIKRTNR